MLLVANYLVVAGGGWRWNYLGGGGGAGGYRTSGLAIPLQGTLILAQELIQLQLELVEQV